MRFIADRCLAVDHNVRIEPNTVAQNRLRRRRAKRADMAIVTDPCPRATIAVS